MPDVWELSIEYVRLVLARMVISELQPAQLNNRKSE